MYLTAHQPLIGYLMPKFDTNDLQLYGFKYSYLILIIYTQLFAFKPLYLFNNNN